jgi:hypothetical protein
MSQNIRATALCPLPPRQYREGRRVRNGHHVTLIDAGESVDRRTVEPHPFLESLF